VDIMAAVIGDAGFQKETPTAPPRVIEQLPLSTLTDWPC